MNLLIVEDDSTRREWFVNKLEGHVPYRITKNPDIAIQLIAKYHPTYIFLDFDLGGEMFSKENSMPVAEYLKEEGFTGKNVIIHSWNPVGVKVLETLLPDAYVAPFGSPELDKEVMFILQEATITEHEVSL